MIKFIPILYLLFSLKYFFFCPKIISIIYVLSLLYIWIKDLLFHKIVEFLSL